MAYRVDGLSFVPKYCPSFKTINEDGSDFDVKAKLNKIESLGFTSPYAVAELGVRLPDEVVDTYPKYAVLKSSHKNLPEIFTVPGGSCVNELFRKVIETLEPNVHQFIPITLLDREKQRIEGDFSFLIIGQKLDSIIADKSPLNIRTTPGPEKRQYVLGFTGDTVVLCKNTMTGKHLWRESIYPPIFFVSDELYHIFMEKKFKGIDKHKMHKIIEE